MEDSWRLSAENQSICQSRHFCREDRRNTKREGTNKKMEDSWRLSAENQSICQISYFCRGERRNTKRDGTNKK